MLNKILKYFDGEAIIDNIFGKYLVHMPDSNRNDLYFFKFSAIFLGVNARSTRLDHLPLLLTIHPKQSS